MTTGPGETLDGLDAIDWAPLQHAYGSAQDVPHQLVAVATGTDDQRRQAMSDLWGNIHHQGTVYQASAHAVPFIARLALDPTLPTDTRAELIRLLGALATGSSYLDVHAPLISGGLSDEEAIERTQELADVRAAHDAVANAAPSLFGCPDRGDQAIFWPLVLLAAQVPESAASFAETIAIGCEAATPRRQMACDLTIALLDRSVTWDLLGRVSTVDADLGSIADESTWSTPVQAAKAIVTILIEDSTADQV